MLATEIRTGFFLLHDVEFGHKQVAKFLPGQSVEMRIAGDGFAREMSPGRRAGDIFHIDAVWVPVDIVSTGDAGEDHRRDDRGDSQLERSSDGSRELTALTAVPADAVCSLRD